MLVVTFGPCAATYRCEFQSRRARRVQGAGSCGGCCLGGVCGEFGAAASWWLEAFPGGDTDDAALGVVGDERDWEAVARCLDGVGVVFEWDGPAFAVGEVEVYPGDVVGGESGEEGELVAAEAA